MDARSYVLDDGRTIEVCVDVDRWWACIKGARTEVIGFPLESILMVAIGLDPAHDEVPRSIELLANRVRRDIPREDWPSTEGEERGTILGDWYQYHYPD
jgi:hypothetical protein